MNFNLKVNHQGVITDYTYPTETAARKALKELVIKPAKEYAATLRQPEWISVRATPRARNMTDVIKNYYIENSSSQYYFLMEEVDGKNELYISGVISEEGRDYDGEVDFIQQNQYDYGQDD